MATARAGEREGLGEGPLGLPSPRCCPDAGQSAQEPTEGGGAEDSLLPPDGLSREDGQDRVDGHSPPQPAPEGT